MRERINKLNDILKLGIIIFFINYIFMTCLIWSISTTYNSAPDENLKFTLCKYLSENWNLPHGGDEAIRDEQWGISYAFTPYLAYMIASIFIRITKIFTNNFYSMVVSARFLSVICITLYSVMCIKISTKLFKGIYKYLFIVLTTQIPQVLYLGSYINNDSFALFIISLIIYCWICGIKSNWKIKDCIFLGISLGLCALSYYNAYGYILCSILIFIGSSINQKISFKEILKKGILIFLIAFLIAGWFFIRNFIIYDGDFLGNNISAEYGEKYALKQYKPSNLNRLDTKLEWEKWKTESYRSFIGYFGYLTVPINGNIYYFFKSIFLIGIYGGILEIILKKDLNIKSDKNQKLFKLTMLVSIVIPIILSLYYSVFGDFQAQGRYLMPGIIPFMYYIVNGIKTVMENYIKEEKIKNIIILLIIFISIIPIYTYFNYITVLS